MLAGALALAVGLLLPVFGQVSPVGLQTRNLSHAKQLGTGVKLYAMDNDGRFPMHLSELVPDYIDAASWTQLLYDPRKDAKDPHLPNFDWLYFGAFFDEKNPPPILIASPRSPTDGSKGRRVVIQGDGSGEIMKEAEYQAELRKTIEAMHKRFDAAKPAP